MANNETVADIVREMFEYPKSWGEYNHLDWKALAKRIQDALDRILAAHKRELAAKDAEIAEIRHWIKSAARWIKCHDIYHTSGNDLIKRAKEILNDDGEFLFKKGEQ